LLASVMMLTMMVIVAGPASASHREEDNGNHYGNVLQEDNGNGYGNGAGGGRSSHEPRRGLR
jgi:hypothetical protein